MTAAVPVTTVRVDDIPTPVGPLRVAVRDVDGHEAVIVAAFADHFDRVAAKVRDRVSEPAANWTDGGTAIHERFTAWVAGDLDALDDVAVDAPGTEFQRRVWAALRAIPIGTTCSYADLATAIGSPGAVRAAGSANGANPVWVLVPCHRVIRSDGSLGGYGGGLDRKAWLLAHEGARLER